MIEQHNSGASLLLLLLLLLSLLIAAPRSDTKAQQPDELADQTTAHGIELYQQGKSDEAIKVLKKVVKKHPDDADAWYYLGLAFNGQGSIGAARPAFEHVIGLRPNAVDAYAKLALALIIANQSERAVAMAKRAIELGDQSPEVHYAMAESSFRKNNSAKAIEEAENTLQIKSDFAPALITKSLAHYSLKQYPEAAASLERFLAISPNDLDAEIWRGQLDELRNRAYESYPDQQVAFTGKEVIQKVRVLSKPEPQYSEEARRAGATGTVLLRTIFSSDGEVKHILVVKALGYGLVTKAAKAARLIKFEPAMKDGKPVSMYMMLEYNFNLY
jgi:TonB family protein